MLSSQRFISSIICHDIYSYGFTLCISNNNDVYSFGYSEKYNHGFEHFINNPKRIKLLSNIKYISCGFHHTLCLDHDGNVYSFGNDNFNQLGLCNKNEYLPMYCPQKLDLIYIKQISCGCEFSMSLSDSGLLYGFGENCKGQLGLGNNFEVYTSPQLIPDLHDIEFVECGGYYVICQSYYNICYSWGDNEFGQLGQELLKDYFIPTECKNLPNNIIDIKCGLYFTLLLTTEGIVYGFGMDDEGQLGIDDGDIEYISSPKVINNLPKIRRIECGCEYSMCIDYDNGLWVFGNNECGQLGLGNNERNIWKPKKHPILSDIIDISSGGAHTFVKTIDNKIYSFGANYYSQLGKETSEKYIYTPIQVFQDKGEIWCSTIGKSNAKSARK